MCAGSPHAVLRAIVESALLCCWLNVCAVSPHSVHRAIVEPALCTCWLNVCVCRFTAFGPPGNFLLAPCVFRLTVCGPCRIVTLLNSLAKSEKPWRWTMLLQYVALFYLVPFYLYWKLHFKSLHGPIGKQTFKRLRLTAPALMQRALRKDLDRRQQVDLFLARCAGFAQRPSGVCTQFLFHSGAHNGFCVPRTW